MPGACPIPPAPSTTNGDFYHPDSESGDCTDGKKKRKFGKRDVFIRVIRVIRGQFLCRLREAALCLVRLFAAMPNPQDAIEAGSGFEEEETERTEMKKLFSLLPLFSPVQKSAIRPVLRSFSEGGNPPSFAVPTEGRQSAIRNRPIKALSLAASRVISFNSVVNKH